MRIQQDWKLACAGCKEAVAEGEHLVEVTDIGELRGLVQQRLRIFGQV